MKRPNPASNEKGNNGSSDKSSRGRSRSQGSDRAAEQKRRQTRLMQKPKTKQSHLQQAKRICHISPVAGASKQAITPTHALRARRTRKAVQEDRRAAAAAAAVALSQAAAPNRAAAQSPAKPKVRLFRVVACATSTNHGGQQTAVDPKSAITTLAHSNTLQASRSMTN